MRPAGLFRPTNAARSVGAEKRDAPIPPCSPGATLARKSSSVSATTLVALRKSSSASFSSAFLAFDSGTVRGPAPYSTAGIPCSPYRRASAYSGVPCAVISSPITSRPLLLQARHQLVRTRQRPQRMRQQQAPDLHPDARLARPPRPRSARAPAPRPPPDLLPESCGGPSSCTTLPGTTLVLVPPSMRPTSMVGESMPGTFDLIFFSSGSWP